MTSALEVVDAIRSAQPTALPLTVVVDGDAKQVRIIMREEAKDTTKTRVFEKLDGYSVKYEVEQTGVGII